MININVKSDDNNNNNNISFDCVLSLTDSANINECFYALIKALELEGYSKNAIDNLIKEAAQEIDERYSFEDYLIDTIYL